MAQENKNNQDDFAANLFQQITNISKASAYDILLDQHKKLEERNKVLEDALRTIYNIENAAFNLSGFDVTRLKKEIEEALSNNQKS